ncbi:MAG: chemotaxis protein CheW [Gammaproteobacteria bacterium]|nr:chemotaxis protein CheW [Gammaproteobacteria bacterium]
MSSNSNTLVDEKLAVSLFLDSLLRETEDVPELDKPEVSVSTPVDDLPVVEIPVVEVKTEVKAEAPIITPPIVKPVPETKAEVEIEIQEEASNNLTVPEWARDPFQILLFEVAGLKLAVPLIELSGVIEWNDTVTEMPGSADFYMGILQHLNYKIAVIDTAKMVLPKNKQSQLVDADPRERVKHIVLIDDYRWGLACDNIGEVITLHPEEVRWRTSKTKRAWLAGTVIDHMCALLNSKGFSAMLEKGQSAEDLA